MADTREQIKEVVLEVMRDEGRRGVQQISNPDLKGDVTDQTIDTLREVDLNELNSMPDEVKTLREFSGKPGEFNSWKQILGIYLKSSPKYYGILYVITNKIVGQVDIALESYATPLN